MLLSPLFKYFNNDIFIGGGIKISKPPEPVLKYRASSELRVQNEVVVTYDSNVRDRYGVELTDISVTQHDECVVDVSIQGYDNFVNLTDPTLHCTVVVVKQSHEYNLNERPTVLLLSSLGREMPVVWSIDTHETRSTGVRNQVNDNRSVENRSRLFYETIFRRSIESQLSNINEYVDLKSNQSFKTHGPYKYDVIVNLDDDGITYTSIKRSFFVHGVYDVHLEPVRSYGVRTGVNLDDSVRLTWKVSNELETVTEIQLRDNDGNVIATFDSAYEISVDTLGEYRGTIRGYVQYKHIDWSPLNYSNAIVFETTNSPRRIEFRVSNDEKYNIGYEQLYIQLVTLDMGTNTSGEGSSILERVVTLRLYEDEARTIRRGNEVIFTHVYDAQIVSGLEVATAYYVSYETNDRLNPVHSDVIDAQYSTRTDPSLVADAEGPEISVDILSTSPSIVFATSVTDASYIVSVRYSLNADTQMERVTTYQQWTPVPIQELVKEIVVPQQEIFVFYKDNTNVKPFFVSSDHGYTSFVLIVEATDILNNRTTKTVLLNI
jgi:hypothetical protein